MRKLTPTFQERLQAINSGGEVDPKSTNSVFAMAHWYALHLKDEQIKIITAQRLGIIGFKQKIGQNGHFLATGSHVNVTSNLVIRMAK